MGAERERGCVVTGASAGIGLATARGLAGRGFSVVMVGRDPEKTAGACEEVRRTTRNDRVTASVCDFASLADVRRLAGDLVYRVPSLQALINNAGVWHSEQRITADGIEETFAVNHLAHFLLTLLLLPRLRQNAPARVITVSSRLHKRPRALEVDDLARPRKYAGMRAYARSKLANVLFANELARREAATGVTSNSLHPGDVASSIVRDSKLLTFGARFAWLAGPLLQSAEEASRTSIHLATAPELETVTGRYFARSREAAPSKAALDEDAARRLWELSESLTGLRS